MVKITIRSAGNKSGTFRIYLPKHLGEPFEGKTHIMETPNGYFIPRPRATNSQIMESLNLLTLQVKAMHKN